MTNKLQRNRALCREIAQIIRETNMSVVQAALIFDLLPETMHKLERGLITPTPMQLIEFMDATRHPLNKLCVNDYKKIDDNTRHHHTVGTD